MSRVQSIEVKLAYVWDCEQCGTENFERAVVHEFSPAEVEELRADGAGDEAQTGNWMTHPEHVKCRQCGTEFQARHFRADEGGEGSVVEQDDEQDE